MEHPRRGPWSTAGPPSWTDADGCARFDSARRCRWRDALAGLPAPGGERFREVFRHGSLQVEVYAPVGHDPQNPHTRDEVYVVVAGRGVFAIEDERLPFETGDLLFAPAGARHRFEDFTPDLGVWVFFYGPTGGEAGGGII